MEHLKTFESYDEDLIVFQELFDMNPNSKDNDLYAFVAKDEYLEEDDGKFKKVLGIEKMMRITKDRQGMGNLHGLKLRTMVAGLKFYDIWIPKEMRNMLENKGYKEIEPWLLDSIGEKIKTREPRQKLTDLDDLRQDVKGRIEQMNKFNL